MPTSLADLLHHAGQLAGGPAAVDGAEQAITALAHTARALDRLVTDGLEPGVEPARRSRYLQQLAGSARAASAAWPPRPGRLPDLLGAAADVAGMTSADLGRPERWAMAIALSETTRRCTQQALSFPPYTNLAILTPVHRAAIAVERLAAADPPHPAAYAILDRAIPNPYRAPGLPPDQAIAEATTRLTAAVRSAAHGAGLTVIEALAAATTGQALSQRQTAQPSPNVAAAATRAARAWRMVRAVISRYDDGTQTHHGHAGAITGHAVELHRLLQSATARPPWVAIAQLPDLANQLDLVTWRWGHERRVRVHAKTLRALGVRHDLSRGIVTAAPTDLTPVLTTLAVAERAAVTLAVQLARTDLPAQRHSTTALRQRAHTLAGEDLIARHNISL